MSTRLIQHAEGLGRLSSINVRRWWAAQQLGLPLRRTDAAQPVWLVREAYLQRNPNGLVPPMEDDDTRPGAVGIQRHRAHQAQGIRQAKLYL